MSPRSVRGAVSKRKEKRKEKTEGSQLQRLTFDLQMHLHIHACTPPHCVPPYTKEKILNLIVSQAHPYSQGRLGDAGFLMRGAGDTGLTLCFCLLSHKHGWGGHLVTMGLTFAILCLDKFLQMKILGQARGMFSLCENLSSPKGWEKVCGIFYSSLWH